MAKLLIDQLSTPFEPGKYTDDYRAKLLDLINHKVAGEEIKIAPAKPEANVMDLMAALQASIEAVKPIPSDPGTTTAKPKKRTPKKTSAQATAGGETDTPAPAKRKKAAPKPKA
jgi:DNA end-binding protein Ku